MHVYCKLPATWVVLLPGAAQASRTSQPGSGLSACAGMQDDLLCMLHHSSCQIPSIVIMLPA